MFEYIGAAEREQECGGIARRRPYQRKTSHVSLSANYWTLNSMLRYDVFAQLSVAVQSSQRLRHHRMVCVGLNVVCKPTTIATKRSWRQK